MKDFRKGGGTYYSLHAKGRGGGGSSFGPNVKRPIHRRPYGGGGPDPLDRLLDCICTYVCTCGRKLCYREQDMNDNGRNCEDADDAPPVGKVRHLTK